MRYAVLLYQDEAVWQTASEVERQQYMVEHDAFAKALAERGIDLLGDALAPVSTATTVRRSGDELAISDGPFAETAEQLGGYYVLEAPDLDEVIELVRLLPEYTIEIRRIIDID